MSGSRPVGRHWLGEGPGAQSGVGGARWPPRGQSHFSALCQVPGRCRKVCVCPAGLCSSQTGPTQPARPASPEQAGDFAEEGETRGHQLSPLGGDRHLPGQSLLQECGFLSPWQRQATSRLLLGVAPVAETGHQLPPAGGGSAALALSLRFCHVWSSAFHPGSAAAHGGNSGSSSGKEA